MDAASIGTEIAEIQKMAVAIERKLALRLRPE
jgi:hypothetical protein